MGPQLIEVSAENKDFAEDALKAVSIGLTAWAVTNFIMGKPTPLSDTAQTLAMVLVGLAVHHMVVDTSIVRFVVSSGQEQYYGNMRRFK